MLFGGYCFGEENSLSLTEFCCRLGELCKKTRWVCFCTQIIGREELTEFSPRNSVRSKKLTEFGVWNRTLRNCIRPRFLIFLSKPRKQRAYSHLHSLTPTFNAIPPSLVQRMHLSCMRHKQTAGGKAVTLSLWTNHTIGSNLALLPIPLPLSPISLPH